MKAAPSTSAYLVPLPSRDGVDPQQVSAGESSTEATGLLNEHCHTSAKSAVLRSYQGGAYWLLILVSDGFLGIGTGVMLLPTGTKTKPFPQAVEVKILGHMSRPR